MPEAISEQLIQALTENRSFTVKIGRSQLTAIPDNFLTAYEALLAIPIEHVKK